MCINCFENEIVAFSSEKEWQAFDKELSKKLSAKQLKFLTYKGDEGHIYSCLSCTKCGNYKTLIIPFGGILKGCKNRG
ncbi:hypothetical protein ACTS9C_01540 [Empedobacter brevis]